MTKSKKNKTVGYCEMCGRFYPTGEYMLKYDRILCNKHMDEWEANHTKEVELAKRTVRSTHH